MTSKDRSSIKRLYWMHNYLPSSISRLFGLSVRRIIDIIQEDQSTSSVPTYECLLCSNEDVMRMHIDGNGDNNKPQNIIMLCESDYRRLTHLQLRRRKTKLIILSKDLM